MKIIGQFDEFGPGMGYPSIHGYLHGIPHPHKEQILMHLRNGQVHMVTATRIVDIISGEQTNIELYFMNDGFYSWSSRILYYVDKYNLRLPDDFVDHIMALRSYSK